MDQRCGCVCELRQQHNLVHAVINNHGVNTEIFTEGWISLTGYSHEELVSSWLNTVHPDDRENCRILWQRATKKSQQFDLRVRRKDGTYCYLLADVVPIKNDEFDGVIGTFIDITNRKIRQLQVESNYELLTLVADSLHVLIAFINREKRYIYVNRGYSEFFNIPRKQIIGKKIDEILKENFANIELQFNQAIRGHKQRFEVTMYVNDNHHRISTMMVPNYDDGGEVKGVFLMAEVINDQLIHSQFEDLERFMSHWRDHPHEFCQFVGRAIARIANRNFCDLHFYIATSYFAYHFMTDRIDHLFHYPNNCIGGDKAKAIKEIVNIKYDKDFVYLIGKGGRHDNIEIMLWRGEYDGHLTYCIRPISENFNPEDEEYWNFRRAENLTDGVIAYPDSRGFRNLAKSKSVADLIVIASNLAGFVGFKC